jgi:alanine racemase
MHRDLVAEIETDAIRHNIALIRQACKPGVRLCVALKGNAYGHGVDVIAPVLADASVEMAAVATIGEAIELREIGWARPILCFGPIFAAPSASIRAERIAAAVKYDLTPTVVDGYGLRDLDAEARRQGRQVSFHVKVDTGMGRMGIAPHTAFDLIRWAARFSHARLEGLYTHLGTADEGDLDFARAQLAQLHELTRWLAAEGIGVPLVHAANSSAIFMLPESHFDMVRPGLAVYGYRSSRHWPDAVALRPSLRLRSHLVLTKQVPAGHAVGYGRTFVTARPTILGIVPIGYNDGYSRSLSNRGVMGLPIGDAPVVGRVSMDQTILDLTDLPDAKVGDEVTIIDNRVGRPNSVESLADLLGTVPYEITCLLGNRVHRTAVRPGGEGLAQEVLDVSGAVSTAR